MNKRTLPGIFTAFMLTASLLFPSRGGAQTPTYAFSVSSPSNNAFPLQSTSSNMVQWLFTPSDFSPTVPTGVFITTIYIKPSNIGTFTSATFTNLLIKIGNTSLTSLSTSTWNSGLTTVLNSSSYSMSGSSLNWIPITLTTPFLYTGSNFIMEMSQTSYTNGGLNLAHDYTNAGRRMWGATGSSSASGSGTGELIFGFDCAPANCSGTPLTPTITSAPFTTAAPLCAGTTTTITGTDPNLPVNGMAYQWQIGSSSTGPWSNVTNGSGAATLVYTTGAVPSTTWYRIGAICTNSNITSYSSGFQVLTGATQPSVISGNSLFCPGDTATYSVTNVPGTTYTWTLPVGWSGFSTSNSILVTPGTTAGTISVSASSSCGVSIARTRAISPGSAPGVPGTITGNNFVCSGSTQTYSVSPVPGAIYYTWSLPVGWTGASTTNSITVTPGTTSGNVTVSAVNGCGPSSAPKTLAVTIITTLANPGVITGSDTVCSGTLQTYSIAPVPGATGYTWSFPNGWSGTTTGTSIQAFPGTTSGNIQVTAAATCALSPVSQKPIYSITTLTPNVTISTPATTLCQGTPISFTATPVNGGAATAYQWKKNGVNVTGTGNIYTDNLLATGDVIQVVMTSGLRCKSAPNVASNTITTSVTPSVTPGVSINTKPMLSICQGTVMTFTTTSTGTGTTPQYQWYKNNVQIGGATGTTYTDGGLLNKDTLTIRLTSNAVCATSINVGSNRVGITVTDTVIPTVSVVASATAVSLGDDVTFTSSSSNGGNTPTYQWVKNGVEVPGETNDTYTSNTIAPGDHVSVTMLSYALCATPRLVSSNEIVMESALGVAGVSGWEGTLSLYPNPSRGQFMVSGSFGASHVGKRLTLEVFSVVGARVYSQDVTAAKPSWESAVVLPSGLSNGSYMLRLSGDGMRATIPFVLNR